MVSALAGGLLRFFVQGLNLPQELIVLVLGRTLSVRTYQDLDRAENMVATSDPTPGLHIKWKLARAGGGGPFFAAVSAIPSTTHWLTRSREILPNVPPLRSSRVTVERLRLDQPSCDSRQPERLSFHAGACTH
jgi:hypothetical protein